MVKKKTNGNGEVKRGRGRPPVGSTPILVRMLPHQIKLLDTWITRHNKKHKEDDPVARPEAIRRAVERVCR